MKKYYEDTAKIEDTTKIMRVRTGGHYTKQEATVYHESKDKLRGWTYTKREII